MRRYNHICLLGLILISFLFMTARSSMAQIPRTMSFQGILTNADGSQLPDGSVTLDIMLYDVETGGTAVWTESQQTIVSNGVFSVVLGKTTPLSAAFDKPYWVGIKVNGESELTPRIPLTASPYSMGAVATVSEPVAGTTFAVADSSGTAKSTITPSGNMWTAGQATFDGGVVVGDSTSSAPTGKISESAGQTDVGGEIGGGIYGISAWSTSADSPAMHASNDSGIALIARSKTGDGIRARSISGRGIAGLSESGIGVKGSSFSNDGIYGVSMTGWAGHFGPGNVHIEHRLKIDDIPQSTSTKYLVSDGGWVDFTTVAPGGSSFGGILTNTPLVIKNPAGDDVVTFDPTGTSNQTGRATFLDGLESTSTDKTAVSGISTNSYGVYGKSTGTSAVYGESTDFVGVEGSSLNGSGVQGITASGDGVYGTASGGGWAGRFGFGNVFVEHKLKVGELPTSTELPNVVWDGTKFLKVNASPPSGGSSFGGTLTDTPLVIKNSSTSTDVVTFNSNGTSTQTGRATYLDGLESTSTYKTAVSGISTNSYGVYGKSDDDSGVYGESTGFPGVEGLSVSGRGVQGVSFSKSGVFGSSSEGDGVFGTSTGGGWAGHFGFGNVFVENKLKVGNLPTSTDVPNVVWDGTKFLKVNASPPTVGNSDLVMNNKKIVVNDANQAQVAAISTTGTGTFNKVEVPGNNTVSSNVTSTGFNMGDTNGVLWSLGVDGYSIPLSNGNILSISKADGYVIKDGSGSPVFQAYPDGRVFASGEWFLFNNATVTGDLTVMGTLTKVAGAFRIDDPLDPLNKYLSHSFVESPDMMNVYNGNVVLDAAGEAVIEMPEWFEALNEDFRYQLSAIGSPGPNLYVSKEIEGNQFRIAGGAAGLKVSWQVTGIRHDAYANNHRIPTVEDKPADKRGKYTHPEDYN